MKLLEVLWTVGMTTFFFLGWVGYLLEKEKRRNAHHDLLQLCHDYDVDFEELRRTQGHPQIRDWFGRE